MQHIEQETPLIAKQTRRIPVSTMLLTQAIALLAFVATAFLPMFTAKTNILLCVITLFTLTTFWPLRTELFDRIIALGAGLISLWCVCLALKGWLPTSVIDNAEVSIDKFIAAIRPYERWAVAFSLILVFTVLIAFAHQMFRAQRTHLVRALAHTLMASIASAALPGWMFLPSIVRFFPSLRNMLGGYIVAILCAVAIILLCAIAYVWMRNADLDERNPYPAIGIALLPVMLAGMLIYVTGLGMLLVA